MNNVGAGVGARVGRVLHGLLGPFGGVFGAGVGGVLLSEATVNSIPIPINYEKTLGVEKLENEWKKLWFRCHKLQQVI